MTSRKIHGRRRRSPQSGFTLIEVMISSVLLLIVFSGLAQIYSRGRVQIGYEEDRRRATAILQARIDGLRRDYAYDTLASLAGNDTTYTVGGLNYTVSHSVSVADPEPQATTLTLQVSWPARTVSGTVTRTHTCSTILARGLPVW